MIPKRIKLAGFLCYKDEQEIAFDGSSLWMLAGLNGSGKSSIFDAVTYAIFGHHRGGRADAVELINKNATGLSVEFDFTIDGQLYQARRTLRRRASGTAVTQQIYRWLDDKFVPVEDTQRKTEFDAWVRDHIGLNYETFTSSVLLLQGRAEKLLDSTAKGRAEVLAGIVDLERYQKLHEKADTQRRTLKARVETWQSHLEATPEVDPFELAEAESAIERADEARRLAQDEVERLFALEARAKQWADLERRSADLGRRQREAHDLLKEADAIERDLQRLREIREVLPHFTTAINQRSNIEQSKARTEQVRAEMGEGQRKLSERDHAIDGLKRTRDTLRSRLAEDEAKKTAVGDRLPRLAATLERVGQCEVRRAERTRLEAEIGKLPKDLPRELARGHERVDGLTALQHAQSPLGRVHSHREDLRRAKDRLRDAQQADAAIRARGEELKAKLADVRPQAEAAERERRAAEERAASERTLADQARSLREEFGQLGGAKTCRACGQPLTAKHFAEEKARRERAVAEADERAKRATADRATAQAADQRLRAELTGAERDIQTAREEWQDAKNALDQAKKDVAQHGRDCERAFAELADSFRIQVAAEVPTDWLATTYPTTADLDEMRERLQQLPRVRQELKELQTAQQRWADLDGQLKATRQALADLEADLPTDAGGLRGEYRRLEAEDKSLKDLIRNTKAEERTVLGELERTQQERERIDRRLTELKGHLATEEATRKIAAEAVTSAKRALPEPWRERADTAALADLNRLHEEKHRLETAKTEDRAAKLGQSRIDLQSLRQALADLERDRATFPEDARRDPAAVLADLQKAKAAAAERGRDLTTAQNARSLLETRRQRRAEVQRELSAAELEHNRYKLLAELLGRDRLQRHLVRQAERQIVDYANGVLDRLSGGQLMLRLVGSDDGTGADKALELEAYNRAAGQAPINVAFLSGSQRFRVAVSLALGIGQYASRQHRPIESVIIDEGFGCLDRHGRQVMIQELTNLRGHLHCILLVSHQEEFAEAFANGYQFKLENGSTVVTRFQR